MSYTKATLADVEAAGAAATETGAAATESGTRATEFANQMQSGIDELSQTLIGYFQQIAEAVQQEAGIATSQLSSADWEGQSKDMATTAEGSLHTRLQTTLGHAMEGTNSFTNTMKMQATDFVSVVQGNFNQIMQNIDVAFQDLSTAEQTFADNMVQVDQTVQFAE